MTKTGVMICGHGSRSQAAVDEFAVLAERLPEFLPDDWPVEYGYLEFANPVIRVGLDKLREQGCDEILAVPGMLFSAMHTKNDIPTVLNKYQAETGVKTMYGRELGVAPKMIAAAGGRVQEAIDKANAELGDLPLEEALNEFETVTRSTDRIINQEGEAIAAQLRATLTSASGAAKALEQTLEEARPATRQLTESTLPAAEATLRDLRATSKALRDVTEKIDEQGAGALLSSQPLPDYKP